MSETGRKELGYPKSLQDNFDIYPLWYGPGLGAGGCIAVTGVTQIVIPYRVPKLVVFNRSILIDSPLDVYIDNGPSQGCNHSAGTQQPFWLALSDDGVMTDAEVKAFNIEVPATPPPHEIFFNHNKIPQPVLLGGGPNPSWSNIIYIHVVWDSATYVTNIDMNEDKIVKVVKHDYDTQVKA